MDKLSREHLKKPSGDYGLQSTAVVGSRQTVDMLIKAEQRFVRMSPTKIRFVVEVIRKVNSPTRAIALLEHVQRRATSPVIKTLKQAVANAKNNFGLSPDGLVIRELMINDGPTFKRWRPVSRGTAHPIAKKTAHIRVILEDRRKESPANRLRSTAKVAEKPAAKKAVVKNVETTKTTIEKGGRKKK